MSFQWCKMTLFTNGVNFSVYLSSIMIVKEFINLFFSHHAIPSSFHPCLFILRIWIVWLLFIVLLSCYMIFYCFTQTERWLIFYKHHYVCSTELTCLHSFFEILKQTLQNFWKLMKTCYRALVIHPFFHDCHNTYSDAVKNPFIT